MLKPSQKLSTPSWLRKHITWATFRLNFLAEQSILGFCIGKKNWMIIDTIAGAKSSASIYSIAETAKANSLKPYDYFEHLLTEIPKHMDDTDLKFCEDLLPWSPKLPERCRKPIKIETK